MLIWVGRFLLRYPELALLLLIAAGYWIGSFNIGRLLLVRLRLLRSPGFWSDNSRASPHLARPNLSYFPGSCLGWATRSARSSSSP
jgi:hypothetical protein